MVDIGKASRKLLQLEAQVEYMLKMDKGALRRLGLTDKEINPPPGEKPALSDVSRGRIRDYSNQHFNNNTF